MLRNRLFWKIFASIWLSLVLTVAGVTVALVAHNQSRFEQASSIAQDPRAGFANRIVATSIETGDETQTRRLLEHWPREPRPPLVVNERGADLIGRAVSPEILAQAREIVSDDDSPRGARLARSPSGASYLVFAPGNRNRPHGGAGPRIGPEVPGTMLVVAFFASLLVSALLARHITQPISRLRDAFGALAAGRLDFRIGAKTPARHDELGELSGDFDKMAAQLEQLVAARDRLLHDVSHELRSPLARMQTAVGLAHQQPERVAGALERIELEASRLDQLVGELLTLARLEAGKQTPGDDYIELRELLSSVVDDARFETGDSGRTIEFFDDLERDVVLHANGLLLHRALENVVRNALQHTPPGSRVEVSLHAAGDRLRIAVRDHGPGIADGDLASVFEPFVRSTASPAGASGFGLGLAIARRAIEAHGGSIVAENVGNGGGLRMLIELPAS
jgi:two-component system OmpR family sensor kinase